MLILAAVPLCTLILLIQLLILDFSNKKKRRKKAQSPPHPKKQWIEDNIKHTLLDQSAVWIFSIFFFVLQIIARISQDWIISFPVNKQLIFSWTFRNVFLINWYIGLNWNYADTTELKLLLTLKSLRLTKKLCVFKKFYLTISAHSFWYLFFCIFQCCVTHALSPCTNFFKGRTQT